jgi:signal transduction histidine kinase
MTDAGPEGAALALRAKVLSRVIAAAVHDIRTPLNTLGLRLPLLAESLEGGPGAPDAAAGQLRALREQLDRIKDLVARLAEVSEPAAPLGYLDLAAYLAQVGGALGYDAKLRHVELVLEPSRGGVRTSADPPRAGRLVLCLVSRALAGTADGGRLVARALTRDGHAVLEVDRTPAEPDRDLDYDLEVLAADSAAAGGRLDRAPQGGQERLTLTMPGNERP